MVKSHIVAPRVLVRNLFSNWGALLLEVAIAFYLTPFIVRTLGIAIYGLWSLVNSLLGYLGLIDLGIRGSVGRYINHYMAREDDARVNEVIATATLFLSVVSLIVVLVSILLGRYFHVLFPKTQQELLSTVAIVLPVMAVNLWLAFITSVYRSLLGARDRFDVINIIGVVGLLLRALTTVAVLSEGYGFIGLVGVAFATNLYACIATLVAAARTATKIRFIPRDASRERFIEMWRFGLASFTARAAKTLIYQSDQIIVMIFFGPGVVGIYSVATMLVQFGQRLIEQIGSTLFPSVTKAGSLRDMAGLKKLFLWQARICFYVAIPLYVGLAVFGGGFIELWMGRGFEQAAVVLAILGVSDLVTQFASSGPTILFSLDKLKFNLASVSVEAAANVVLSVLFVVLLGLGIEGVALGTLVSALLLEAIANPLYAMRTMGVRARVYVVQIVARVVPAAIWTMLLFSVIDRLLFTTGWLLFTAKVGMAAIAYLCSASFIIFQRQQLSQIRIKAISYFRR